MRLCVHESQFDPAVYQSLGGSEVLGWEELARVRAAVELISDEAEQYSDWVKNNLKRYEALCKQQRKLLKRNAMGAEGGASEDGDGLGRADYERELEQQRQGLANAQRQLKDHRAALARGVREAQLEDEHVEWVEGIAERARAKIEQLEDAIEQLFGGEAASVKE